MDKKLIIETGFSGKGIDEFDKAVKRLGITINKAFGGFSLNGKQGTAEYAKQIAGMSKEMLKFHGISKETAKLWKDSFGAEIKKYNIEIDKSTIAIDRLNKAVEKKDRVLGIMTKAGFKDTKAFADTLESRGRIADRSRELDIERAKLRLKARELAPDDESSTGGGSSSFRKFAGAGLSAMAIGAAVANAIQQGAGAYQGFKNIDDRNKAQLQSFQGRLLNEAAAGDFSTLYFMNRRGKDGKTGIERAQEIGGGQGATKLMYGAGGAAGVIGLGLAGAGIAALGAPGAIAGIGSATGMGTTATGVAGLAAGVGGAGFSVLKAYESFKNLWHGSPAAAEQQSVTENLDLQKAQHPWENAVVQQMQNNAASRLQANKNLQGLDKNAMYTGAEFGSLSENESYAMAHGLMRKFGRVGAENMEGALTMESRGLDRNVSGDMLGTMTMSTGGNSIEANRRLETILSNAFRHGFKDARVGEEIAHAAAEASVGGRMGRADTTDYANFMSRGLGKGSTVRDIQDNVSGAQQFDQFIQNNSAMQSRRASIIARAMPGIQHQNPALFMNLMNASPADFAAQGKDGLLKNEMLHFLGATNKMGQALLAGEPAGLMGALSAHRISEDAPGVGAFIKFANKHGGPASPQAIEAAQALIANPNVSPDYKYKIKMGMQATLGMSGQAIFSGADKVRGAVNTILGANTTDPNSKEGDTYDYHLGGNNKNLVDAKNKVNRSLYEDQDKLISRAQAPGDQGPASQTTIGDELAKSADDSDAVKKSIVEGETSAEGNGAVGLAAFNNFISEFVKILDHVNLRVQVNVPDVPGNDARKGP